MRGQTTTFLFPRDQKWDELTRPPPLRGCSFSLRDEDVLLWDRSDMAAGCDIARCPGNSGERRESKRACWKRIAHLRGTRFRPGEPFASDRVTTCDAPAGLAFWKDRTETRHVQLPCAAQPEAAGASVFIENAPGRPAVVTPPRACPHEGPSAVIVLARSSLELEDRVSLTAPTTGDTVLQAGGRCFLGRDVHITGAMRCETIHVQSASFLGATTLTGSLYGFARCDTGKCADDEALPGGQEVCRVPFADFDCEEPGVCLGDNIQLTGDALTPGDICLGKGVHVHGTLAAQDDVGMLEDDFIEGRLVGGDTVEMGPQVLIRPGREMVPVVFSYQLR